MNALFVRIFFFFLFAHHHLRYFLFPLAGDSLCLFHSRAYTTTSAATTNEEEHITVHWTMYLQHFIFAALKSLSKRKRMEQESQDLRKKKKSVTTEYATMNGIAGGKMVFIRFEEWDFIFQTWDVFLLSSSLSLPRTHTLLLRRTSMEFDDVMRAYATGSIFGETNSRTIGTLCFNWREYHLSVMCMKEWFHFPYAFAQLMTIILILRRAPHLAHLFADDATRALANFTHDSVCWSGLIIPFNSFYSICAQLMSNDNLIERN